MTPSPKRITATAISAPTSESASPDPTDDHGFPWEFRPGTELVERWSLPDAAGNPEFGLPRLPERDLPETPVPAPELVHGRACRGLLRPRLPGPRTV